MRHDPFVGTWELQVEQSEYEVGEPPASGLYRIQPQGEGYLVTMRWETADGQQREMSYTSIADGKDYAYENPEVAEFVSMTRVAERRLVSATKKGGQMIAHACRELAEDEQTMRVTQSGVRPDGTWFDNVSIYKRQV
jgi:hypothetical protein